MTLTEADLDQLRSLEESLWREATRFDRSHMERVLAPDFSEFGRSGRRFSRDAALAVEVQPIGAQFPLEQFVVRELTERTALVTYISEVGPDAERANRSSIWTRGPLGWQLRFHQGTPAGR